jgi:hypothetical protein
MPPAALLRYELVLLCRSFAEAFGSWRDRMLLAIVLALGMLWLRHSLQGLASWTLPKDFAWLALAAAAPSYQWNRLLIRRLCWLAEESALAPCAAARAARCTYLLAAQMPAAIPLALAAALLWIATGQVWAAALAVLAYPTGALAAAVRIGGDRKMAGRLQDSPAAPAPPADPHAACHALLRTQLHGAARRRRALLLVLAGHASLTFAGAFLTRGAAQAAHFAAAVVPSLLLLSATARNDAKLAGFLAFAGYRSGFVALAVCILPAAGLAAASAAVLASGSPEAGWIVAVLALLHLGAALIAVARVWLSPGRDGRKVDFQVQAEAAGLIAAGLMLPPLALLALIARLWMLRTGYRAAMWLHP